MADPLAVSCEDCLAATNTPCVSAYLPEAGVHESRQRLADLRALTHGTCALCGQFMVYGTVLNQPPDAWHPDPTDAAACPPLPDPTVDWNGYADAVNAGLSPGHPGVEHFVHASRDPEGHPCGHEDRTPGCGGCDPGAIEYVKDDGDPTWRKVTPAVCPECTAGKCGNCTTITLDPVLDDFTPCTCTHPT